MDRPAEECARAEATFKQLGDFLEILTDRVKRKLYDEVTCLLVCLFAYLLLVCLILPFVPYFVGSLVICSFVYLLLCFLFSVCLRVCVSLCLLFLWLLISFSNFAFFPSKGFDKKAIEERAAAAHRAAHENPHRHHHH